MHHFSKFSFDDELKHLTTEFINIHPFEILYTCDDKNCLKLIAVEFLVSFKFRNRCLV